MAYFPFQPGQQPMSSSQGVVIASDQSPVSVAGTVIVTGLQGASVSGQLGASIIGLPPVNVTNTNLNVSGSVAAFVVGNASLITVAQGSIAAAIVSGSISATFTPPANQSVSGTVGSSIIGQVPVFIIGGSVATATTNSSVMLLNGANVIGSITALQGTTPWLISSVYGNVSGSIAGTYTEPNVVTSITGLALVFKSNVSTSVMTGVSVANPLPVSVQGVIQISGNPSVSGTLNINTINNPLPSGTNLLGTIAGSVVAFQGSGWSGSVAAFQAGTQITSVINITPSSLLVGNYSQRNDNVASFLGGNLTWNPLSSDSAGRFLMKPFAAEESRLDTVSSVVSTSVTALFNSVVGLRNYVTDVMVVNTGSVATLVTFQDGSTSILGFTIAPAGGGSNINGMAMPMRSAPAQDFSFKAAVASSVLYVTAKGYKAP